MFEVKEGRIYVTTSTGWRVECMPYASQVMLAGTALPVPQKPEPPTYTVIDPTDGEEILIPLTEEIVNLKDDLTDAEKEAWAEYSDMRTVYEVQEAFARQERTIHQMRFIALKATQLVDPPDFDEWAQERVEIFGMEEIPEGWERQYTHFATEVCCTAQDTYQIMSGIFRASGYALEVLDSIEESFQRDLGESEWAVVEEPAEEDAGEAETDG